MYNIVLTGKSLSEINTFYKEKLLKDEDEILKNIRWQKVCSPRMIIANGEEDNAKLILTELVYTCEEEIIMGIIKKIRELNVSMLNMDNDMELVEYNNEQWRFEIRYYSKRYPGYYSPKPEDPSVTKYMLMIMNKSES